MPIVSNIKQSKLQFQNCSWNVSYYNLEWKNLLAKAGRRLKEDNDVNAKRKDHN